MSQAISNFRMPAEWEEHDATWIAWPHEKTDWPEKIEAIHWVYAEIVRGLSYSERTEILCDNKELLNKAKKVLELSMIDPKMYRLHLVPNDRGWLRDSLPTGVKDEKGQTKWINWYFNAWAKYDNCSKDSQVKSAVSEISKIELVDAIRPDNNKQIVLEGGSIETDGEGTLLTTEECLLSDVQERNSGLDRAGYEQIFKKYLGIDKTIWLGDGCVGDDTHGHIDDIARFVTPGKVLLACEDDPSDTNYKSSQENYKRLTNSTDAKGRKLEVIKLPFPRAIWFGEERLPASYANFYIANKVVLVPTFNDENDSKALQIIKEQFPNKRVIGINAVDLVLGQGTLHCLSQQQPK